MSSQAKRNNNSGFQRKSATREVHKILLVCEGKKTEWHYFEDFRSELNNLVKLKVVGKGKNVLKLVEKAIAERNRNTGENRYNQIWCVFDRDEGNNTRADFIKAIKLAGQNGISVAYSNPKFELWYLLHFVFHNTPIRPDDYDGKLSGKLSKPYQKTAKGMYEKLLEKQGGAIKNAARLLNQYTPRNPVHDDPSTTVHILVNKLNEYREEPQ